jgi:hypothetical protein
VVLAPSDNLYVLRSLLESHINIIDESESSDATSESGLEALITAGIKGSVLRKSYTSIMDAMLDRIHGLLQRDLIITSLYLSVVADMNGPLQSLIAHYNSQLLNLSEDEVLSLLGKAVEHNAISNLQFLLHSPEQKEQGEGNDQVRDFLLSLSNY